MMKFTSYFVASVLLMLGTVYYAYYTYRQFYPTVLILVSSKVAYIVIGNLLFAVALLVARIFKSLFFGQLRDTEVELLVDTAKYTIPETCLALTIFRNELSPAVIALFGTLIFIKLLHKLSKCRIEYTEQLLPLPVASQMRVYLLLTALYVIDFIGVFLSVMHITTYGRSVLILFGFEFGLLIIYTVNMTVRFVIQVVDAMTEAGLSSKGLYLMLTDMICEIVKFLTYLAFFGLIFVYYGIPIHILRDVYMAYTSCARKVVSFIKYLQLTRNLDSRFEDATPEEVAAAGHCLVCREDLTQGKKLRCGHVFHLDCLRMWLQHQQSCPLCRANISVADTAPVVPAPAAAVAGADGAVPAVPAPGADGGPAAAAGGAVAEGAVPAVGAPAVAPAGAGAAPARGQGAANVAPAAPLIREATPAVPAAGTRPAITTAAAQSTAQQTQPSRAAAAAVQSYTGPRVFGVPLSWEKALRNIQAPFPRFCVVAAEPDVPVLRDPVRSASEIRRINTGTIVFVTLRVQGGDGSSWLKAPDGWILETSLATGSNSTSSRSVEPTLYSVIPVTDASSSGADGDNSSEGQSGQSGAVAEVAASVMQRRTAARAVVEAESPAEVNRKVEPSRSTEPAALSSSSAESSPSKADASGSRFYSRDHQRSSRLFEQFESKRTPVVASIGVALAQEGQQDVDRLQQDIKARDSPSEQPFPVTKQSSARPPFSSMIDCSDNEEAEGRVNASSNFGGQRGPSAASPQRVSYSAGVSSDEQQIEDCLQRLQGLLARHPGSQYDDLYEIVSSVPARSSTRAVPRKLQRLVQMQSHMEQVAGNLVALSSNVLQCQKALEQLIKDSSVQEGGDTVGSEVKGNVNEEVAK